MPLLRMIEARLQKSLALKSYPQSDKCHWRDQVVRLLLEDTAVVSISPEFAQSPAAVESFHGHRVSPVQDLLYRTQPSISGQTIVLAYSASVIRADS